MANRRQGGSTGKHSISCLSPLRFHNLSSTLSHIDGEHPKHSSSTSRPIPAWPGEGSDEPPVARNFSAKISPSDHEGRRIKRSTRQTLFPQLRLGRTRSSIFHPLPFLPCRLGFQTMRSLTPSFARSHATSFTQAQSPLCNLTLR